MEQDKKGETIEDGEVVGEAEKEVAGEVVKAGDKSLPVVGQEHTGRYMHLMEIAISKGANIEQLEKLMDLQERWDKGEAKKAYFQAMSVFQSEVPPIYKKGFVSYEDSNGNTVQYGHARIEDIADTINPYLAKHGLSYRFEQVTGEKMLITIICIITHEAGHSERSEMCAYPDQSGKKNPIQQIASAVTYLKRYTLLGGFGLTVRGEDDDAGGMTNEEPATYYPDELFKKSFPTWEKTLLAGIKTADELINYLKGKDVNLSESQIKSIKKVGQANANANS